MGVTPRSLMAGPVGALKDMLAQCTRFKKLVQAANETEAADSIFIAGEDGEPERPFAVVRFGNINRAAASGGSRSRLKPGGILKIDFEIQMNWPAVLTTVTDSTHLTATSLIGLADDFFKGLVLKVGENDPSEVTSFNGTTGAMVLATALTTLPNVGDEAVIRPETAEDAFTFFTNVVGDILEDFEALSGTGGCLAFTDLKIEDCGRSQKEQDSEDFYGVVCELGFS